MKLKYCVRTKIELLRKFDWTVVEGFKFANYQPNEEIVISFDEVFKKLKEGTQIFCMESGSDYFLELSEAWEVFIDFITDELDTEDEEVVIKYLNQFIQL